MDRGTTDIGKGKRDYTKSHCPHGKQKSFCIPFGGNGICVLQKRKYTCTECAGSTVCKHGSLECYCIPCGGAGICDRGKQKSFCKDCGGSALYTSNNDTLGPSISPMEKRPLNNASLTFPIMGRRKMLGVYILIVMLHIEYILSYVR